MALIMITSRCDMKCIHCCFSCDETGEDMSDETFAQSLAIEKDIAEIRGRPDVIVLSGGEPTLHPHLLDYLDVIIKYPKWFYPLVLTNGKNTDVCREILDLADHGCLSATLTRDRYHGPIDNQLLAEWRMVSAACEDVYDFRVQSLGVHVGAILSEVSDPLINTGRARQNGIGVLDSCCCESPFITPEGQIFSCGCKAESFGSVYYSQIPLDFLNLGLWDFNARYCGGASRNVWRGPFL